MIPGNPLTLCMPKVSKIFKFLSIHPVKYSIPKQHTAPETAPSIIHAHGFTNNPVLDPAPIQPDKEPLNKSMTENLPLIKMLTANEAITLPHIERIVFIMTMDFSNGVYVRYWLLMEGTKQKMRKHPM